MGKDKDKQDGVTFTTDDDGNPTSTLVYEKAEGGVADGPVYTEGEREEVAKVIDEMEQVKIVIHRAVNGHPAGMKLTVPRNHPFYGGLVDQGMAEVIG